MNVNKSFFFKNILDISQRDIIVIAFEKKKLYVRLLLL